MIEPIAELIEALSRLPGLGRRSASRAALALVREQLRLLQPLEGALRRAKNEVCCCAQCGAFTVLSENPCKMCTDPARDDSIICVVEEPSDIIALEGSGAFKGRYHVLGGKLSPVRKMGPEKLRIAELVDRIKSGGAKEILIAVSTDMEGDATAGYIQSVLESAGSGVKVSRLALGLPVDSGIAYSDPLTLRRAISSRTFDF